MIRMRSASRRSSLLFTALQMRVDNHAESHVTDFGRFGATLRLG